MQLHINYKLLVYVETLAKSTTKAAKLTTHLAEPYSTPYFIRNIVYGWKFVLF